MAMLNDHHKEHGWERLNGGRVPQLNFGACTGTKTEDLHRQLKGIGQPARDLEYHNFDKPQLAIMTLGGNDLDFGS